MELLSQLLILITAIVFYFIGRYSQKTEKIEFPQIKNIFKHKEKAGAFTVKKQSEIDYNKSKEKLIEKEFDRVLKDKIDL